MPLLTQIKSPKVGKTLFGFSFSNEDRDGEMHKVNRTDSEICLTGGKSGVPPLIGTRVLGISAQDCTNGPAQSEFITCKLWRCFMLSRLKTKNS